MLNLGKETVIEALGQKWTMGRLELRVIREFRDWVRTQVNPYAAIDRLGERFDKLTPQHQDRLIKEANAKADLLERFTMSSKFAQEWMRNEWGAVKLLQLLFTANHPDITEDQAFGILREKPEAVAQAITDAMGEVPGGNAAAAPAG